MSKVNCAWKETSNILQHSSRVQKNSWGVSPRVQSKGQWTTLFINRSFGEDESRMSAVRAYMGVFVMFVLLLKNIQTLKLSGYTSQWFRLTHNEALSVGQLLEKLPEVLIALLIGGTQYLQRQQQKTDLCLHAPKIHIYLHLFSMQARDTQL